MINQYPPGAKPPHFMFCDFFDFVKTSEGHRDLCFSYSGGDEASIAPSRRLEKRPPLLPQCELGFVQPREPHARNKHKLNDSEG